MISVPDAMKDLLQTDVAMLSTVGPDGQPQVTALWFFLDDDGDVKLSLNSTRQKTKNLGAHPQCTLFILDRANPYRAIEIRADAEITPDDAYVFADKVGQKYNMDMRTMDGPGQSRVMVTLRPVKVNVTNLGG